MFLKTSRIIKTFYVAMLRSYKGFWDSGLIIEYKIRSNQLLLMYSEIVYFVVIFQEDLKKFLSIFSLL